MEHDVTAAAFFKYLNGPKSINTARKYAACVSAFLKLMEANGYESFTEMPPGLLNEFAAMLSQEKKRPSTVRA